MMSFLQVPFGEVLYVEWTLADGTTVKQELSATTQTARPAEPVDRPQGGPAFPGWDPSLNHYWRGMQFRDWLAGKALVGLLGGIAPASQMDMPVVRVGVAQRAYEVADAMLKARER